MQPESYARLLKSKVEAMGTDYAIMRDQFIERTAEMGACLKNSGRQIMQLDGSFDFLGGGELAVHFASLGALLLRCAAVFNVIGYDRGGASMLNDAFYRDKVHELVYATVQLAAAHKMLAWRADSGERTADRTGGEPAGQPFGPAPKVGQEVFVKGTLTQDLDECYRVSLGGVHRIDISQGANPCVIVDAGSIAVLEPQCGKAVL